MEDAQKKFQVELGEYYVAYIDILGFKEIISTLSANKYNEWHNFLVKNMKQPIGRIFKKDEGCIFDEKIPFMILSDSLVFYLPTNNHDALYKLIVQCLFFQLNMLESAYHLLTRGAIVKGHMCFNRDKNIIFGKGLVDAYLQERNNAKYPRIIIEKSIFDDATNNLNNPSWLSLTNGYIGIDTDYYEVIEYWNILGEGQIMQIMNYLSALLSVKNDSSVRDKILYVKRKIENKIISLKLQKEKMSNN